MRVKESDIYRQYILLLQRSIGRIYDINEELEEWRKELDFQLDTYLEEGKD